MRRKFTTEEFIERAACKHGLCKFNYCKVNYKGSKKNIHIICTTCKTLFEVIAGNHLFGQDCPNCFNRYRRENNFITKAKLVHGNKYDYSLVDYIKTCSPVKIICNSCGNVFDQLPMTHINGHDKCCYQVHPNSKKSLKDFIQDAKVVHGDKYNYDNIKYKGAKIKVQIWCPDCQDYFWQIPNDHLTGHRCTNCYLYGSKGGVTKLNLPLYDTYAKQVILYQEVFIVEQTINNTTFKLLGVNCSYNKCSNIFVPNIKQVRSRVSAINGKRLGESNLYCSDECKQKCKAYNFNSSNIDPDSKLYKPKSDKQQARSCQTDHLKQLQIDEVDYNYCEKCGEIVTTVELHHTLEVAKFGLEAINSSGHLLVCKKCHKELTKQCR